MWDSVGLCKTAWGRLGPRGAGQRRVAAARGAVGPGAVRGREEPRAAPLARCAVRGARCAERGPP